MNNHWPDVPACPGSSQARRADLSRRLAAPKQAKAGARNAERRRKRSEDGSVLGDKQPASVPVCVKSEGLFLSV